jgi:hypothetical protein
MNETPKEKTAPAAPDSQGPLSQIKRPGRALIGWMLEEHAMTTLAGNTRGVPPTAEHVEKYRIAQTHVMARKAFVLDRDPVSEPASQLSEHIESLKRADFPSSHYFADGWDVKMVDLTRVCAIQPVVFLDHSEQRTDSVNANNIKSVIDITLPLQARVPVPPQFDPNKNAWIFSSRNPNLRVAGNFGTPLPNGFIGYGFVVEIALSFVQVARYNGRCYLRDGYHRSLGLLKRGISVVPAFVKEYSMLEEFAPPTGMLPAGAYRGDRPPMLVDYLDDNVSANVLLPSTQKLIVIQGMELAPFG